MSNGSMMKATPIAIWSRKLNLDDLFTVVQQDTTVTHSTKAISELITAYCLIIHTLIEKVDQPNRAQLAI